MILLIEELMLTEEEDYATVMVVWAANIGLELVIMKGLLLMARLKDAEPVPMV